MVAEDISQTIIGLMKFIDGLRFLMASLIGRGVGAGFAVFFTGLLPCFVGTVIVLILMRHEGPKIELKPLKLKPFLRCVKKLKSLKRQYFQATMNPYVDTETRFHQR